MDNASKYQKYASMKRRSTIKKIGIYLILIVISVIWLLPFVYIVAQSFAKTYVYGDFFPQANNLTGNNYVRLFTDSTYPFWRWWLNTFMVSVVTAIVQTVLSLATAYSFSRLRFKVRKKLMKLILVLGMFPGFLGMIIIYYLFDAVGMATSIFSLVLIYIGGSAMNYYIAKGFFDTLPRSLDEAAMLDGANKNTVFFKVIMPLSKPIVVYTLLLAFVGPWGDYIQASYFANGQQDLFNVAVGLQQMLAKGQIDVYFPTFCAGGVVTAIPIMALFFALQKYYVEGVTGGAVKG